jgi:hypothetical protein
MADLPTRQEFIDFLNNKQINYACEVCGITPTWVVPEGKEMFAGIPVLQTGGFHIPPPSIPAAIAICNNCGNIRSHALAIVKPSAMGG